MGFDNKELLICSWICSSGNNGELYDFGMDGITGMAANDIVLKGSANLDECLPLWRMLFQCGPGCTPKTSGCVLDGWSNDGIVDYHQIAVVRGKELCDGLAVDFTLTGICWSRTYGKQSQKTASMIKMQENIHFIMYR